MRNSFVTALLSIVVSFTFTLNGIAATKKTKPPAAPAEKSAIEKLGDDYLDHYFAMYPTRATEAGLHTHDRELEEPTPEKIYQWLDYNHRVQRRLLPLERPGARVSDEVIDSELLVRQASSEIFRYETLRVAQRDPLFWSGIAGDATTFLLVRDDRSRSERIGSAISRASKIPALVTTAIDTLSKTAPSEIAPEICTIAARQAHATARFYREGFPRAAGNSKKAIEAGAAAADAVEHLAKFLDDLSAHASGSPRLGANYTEAFRLGTGMEMSPEKVLTRAEIALKNKRSEAADYGRKEWSIYFAKEPVPTDDAEVLRRFFARIAADHASNTEGFVKEFVANVDAAEKLVKKTGMIDVPWPRTITIDRSPSYFVGQSVGGVYPAGPYNPDAKTLFYLPTPPDDATPAEREAFFRDFNDHFAKMITPHEIIPGHYLQMKYAAHGPSKLRAIFADPVYVEGWGTFSERLMLDNGWGGPLDRMAHFKKQIENIARAIVDIRVHTRNMTRDEVVAFAKNEAFQDDQFAANMWTRAITSAPQLTDYYLGYNDIALLYQQLFNSKREHFSVREFSNGMMSLGPVPVKYYRTKLSLRE